jgi:hypothetical protein
MPKKRFERPAPSRRIRKIYLIVTEGEKTERIYFERFKADQHRINIELKIFPAQRGDSDPKSVLKRARDAAKNCRLEPSDEIWIVVDVDQWGAATLDSLCEACQAGGFLVAVSNPCFEFWLQLHQKNPPRPDTVKSCETELRKLLGDYEKNGYDVSKLVLNIHHALRNAELLERESIDPWPTTPGTQVHRLVKKFVAQPE